MSDNNWLLKAIQAKSDQLNAVDIPIPITRTVASVHKSDSKEQPANVVLDDPKRPYKPCKSMLRVLVACWGANPESWVGRQMTLFCDPSVKWAGESVGGIRISHLSHLGQEKRDVQLNESKHKKITWTVFNIETPSENKSMDERVAKAIASLKACDTIEKLNRTWANCSMLINACDDGQKELLCRAKGEQQKTFEVNDAELD